MNNKILLIIACILIILGITKPEIPSWRKPSDTAISIVVEEPSNETLKRLCIPVIKALKDGDSSRVIDAKRLSSLYNDIATLIQLNQNHTVIKNTEEIRQANSLSGIMLHMNLKDKYPDLAESAQAVIVAGIGDDIIMLDENLRNKAVEAFRALSWACNEGSK